MLEALLSGALGGAVMLSAVSVVSRMGRRVRLAVRAGYISICVSGFMAVMSALDADPSWLQLAWALGAFGAVSLMLVRRRGPECDTCPHLRAWRAHVEEHRRAASRDT